MSTRLKLLKLLEENREKYLSGQEIGAKLSVSRNSIWKAINQLKRDGYSVDSRSGVGYKLKSGSNALTKSAIRCHLKYPCSLQVFDSVDSTNSVAKSSNVKAGLPLVIVANKQTAGRGRLGRTFVSPAGSGLYITIAIKPEFDLNKSLYVTMACAVAVCRSIETVCGIKTKIKWVNDIFYGNKKVCGILTEAQTNFETGKIDSLIMGIGVNCFPSAFPDDIKEVAGYLAESASDFSRSMLAASIFNNVMDILADMESRLFLREYKNKCFVLGKNITIHPNYSSSGIKARAIDIDSNGGLVIEYLEGRKNRTMETITTGEISIRIMED